MLPLHRLIVFILSITSNGKGLRVDDKIGLFFNNARRAGLWPEAEPCSRSAITKARNKIPWKIFSDLFIKVVHMAYELWPTHDRFLWFGLNVIAVDGSKFSLPATEQMRSTFQPKCGFQHGKGHYPQALINTAFDVFRRIPVARTVTPANGSERNEALEILPLLPRNTIVLFDRGYPSYDLFRVFDQEPGMDFLFRCPTRSTFPAVMAFMSSGSMEARLRIDPSYEFRHRHGQSQGKPVTVRAIKVPLKSGEVGLLLTSLLDATAYPTAEIITLYQDRWAVEDYYRNEKSVLGIETFHARTPNGVTQELFAAPIMAVIAGLLRVTAMGPEIDSPTMPQAKHSIISVASEAAFMVSELVSAAWKVFQELLVDIKRVLDYKPKNKRSSYPRVSKKPKNRWIIDRAQKMTP